MQRPHPRGPVSEHLMDQLVAASPDLEQARAQARRLADSGPALDDEDLQLSLLICYELHYRGLDGVDDEHEWHPGLLGVRQELERGFVEALQALRPLDPGGSVAAALNVLVDTDDGPSLSGYVRRQASLREVQELAIHRSVYQLKEADPHTWGIPRLTGGAKSALVEVQHDEYGGGRPDRMHAALFATTMQTLGLDPTYGAYVDCVPGTTLATSNLISLFGLHRRYRGALVGHLAAFEMTSAVPSSRIAAGLRRLGFGSAATNFYDEHAEADAVHEQVVAVDLLGALLAAEPELRADVLFGAACCLALERRVADRLLGCWQTGQTSLLAAAGRVGV